MFYVALSIRLPQSIFLACVSVNFLGCLRGVGSLQGEEGAHLFHHLALGHCTGGLKPRMRGLRQVDRQAYDRDGNLCFCVGRFVGFCLCGELRICLFTITRRPVSVFTAILASVSVCICGSVGTDFCVSVPCDSPVTALRLWLTVFCVSVARRAGSSARAALPVSSKAAISSGVGRLTGFFISANVFVELR